MPYNSDEIENKNNIDPNLKYADYPEKIVELINSIREDPVGIGCLAGHPDIFIDLVDICVDGFALKCGAGLILQI